MNLDGAQAFGNHRTHQIGITAVGEAQIEVGNDGDRYEYLLREVERCEEHHRSVRSAHHGDRSAVAGAQSHGIGDRYDGEGSQLGAKREEHALQRFGQQEVDIEHRADAHEDQAGDQAVAEGEGVDRLQEIDLQDVHQRIGVRYHRIEEEVARRSAGEDQYAGIHGGHAQSHRDHHQRFENSLTAQIDQQDSEQNQPDAGVHDRRIGLQQGRNALKYVVQIEFFHNRKV